MSIGSAGRSTCCIRIGRERLLGFLVAIVFVTGCYPQDWEIGAAAGYGVYRNASIYAPAGKATAGFRNRFAAGAVVSEELYEHIGGDFRYTYQDGDPFLEAGSVKTNIQGQSHAFHYDVLFHVRPRQERIRPYIAAGAGAKLYVVSGPANPSQPLRNIGLLTTRDEAKVLVTAGGGVKVRIGGNVVLRFDFRDYITPFPKKLIAPVPLGTARGIFHQYTPLVGVAYAF